MDQNIVLKTASADDIDFILEAVIESERSGTDIISYCSIFSLSVEEFKEIVRRALMANVPGQQFYLNGFLVAFVDDKPAATCCSWVEGLEGISSSLIRTSLMMSFIDREKLEHAREIQSVIKDLILDRESDTIQIEHVYVRKEFRGKGLAAKIINKQIENLRAANADLKKAQLIVTKTNEAAQQAYQKMNFRVIDERYSPNKEVLAILPSNTILLMEKTIS